MGPPSRLTKAPRPLRDLAGALLFGGLYLLAAELTRSLGPTDPALLWVPSGLYVGALIVSDKRLWPLLACAALGASFGASILAGHSPTVSLAFAVPSAAEGLLGALVVMRIAKERFSLERVRDVAALIVGAAAVANGLTALSAAAAAVQAFDAPFAETWLRWWGAHALGIVVVAPIVVGLAARPRRLPARPRLAEAGLVAAGLAVIAVFLYSAEPLGAATVVAGAVALPLLLWTSWRWSPDGAALGALVPALGATYLAAHTADPFGLGSIATSEIVVVQAFLATLAVASLAFGAVAAERRAAQRDAERTGRRLHELVGTVPDAYLSIDNAGLIADWSPGAERLLGWSRGEALGRRLHETVVPESVRGTWMAAVERRAVAGESDQQLALHKDGRELPVALTISPSAAEDANATHVFIRDDSERTRLRSELKEADEQLAERVAELTTADERATRLADGLARRSEELEAASGERRQLHAELATARGERERLRTELEAAGDERARLRSELEAADGERERLRASLETASGERERLRTKLANAERQRAEAATTAERDRRELAEVSERVGGERQRLERALDAMVMSFAEADRERMLLRRRATELIVRYDRRGICRYASPACARLLGYEPSELVGRQGADLLHPDDRGQLHKARAAEGDTTFQARLLRKDGASTRVEATFSPVRDRRDGKLVAVEASVRRVPEGALQHMPRLGDHDPLTGLYTQARFEEDLRGELATADRYGSRGAVLAVDLDGFTAVNGLVGRPRGDELLRGVADALRRRLRSTDAACRIGGDRFAVLLRRAAASQATDVASALLEAVRHAGRADRRAPLGLTASIGIATFGDGRAARAEELLVEAEIAVQDAKQTGGDRAAAYDPAGERPAALRDGLGWADQIRAAIEHDRFELRAEPIVNLADGHPLRHQLLPWMESPGGELVPPAAFMPAAERLGLAGEVDRLLLRRAIGMLAAEGGGNGTAAATEDRTGIVAAEDRTSGATTHVHGSALEVSLSAGATSDPDLHAFVASELRACGADPSRLCISIAESAALAGTDRAAPFVRGLAELGCKVGLDRFGEGVASFLHAEQLPIAWVKLDAALVERLVASESAGLVVRSIADVARGLGLQTIAPRTAGAEALPLLPWLGVGYAQEAAPPAVRLPSSRPAALPHS